MPAGIITRFISRIHYLIRGDHYWKNGVELEFYGCIALVVSDSFHKRIRISVSGSSPVQLMAVIRSHFDHIHDTLNMKKEEHFFEEVPCNCSKCISEDKPHYFKYHVLQKMMEMNRNALCEKGYQDVSTQTLLHGLLPPEKTEKLFDTVVTIASQVQGISKTLQRDENSRNTVVALLLGTRGFRVKDQTRWGRSASGLSIGEIAIKIEDDTGRTIAVIESVNLDSFNSRVIANKLKRLLDSGCTSNNYHLVYSQARNFSELWKKYFIHLLEKDVELKIIEAPKELDTHYVGIRAATSLHLVSEKEVTINHILIDMGGGR